ncbi:MAG: hypothetical protein WDO74_26025 [Pseudomonadota bacterium]
MPALLSASPANVPKAVEAAERIVKDGKDAGEVVRRVRALFKPTALEKVQLDLGEVIEEVLRLLDSYPARKECLSRSCWTLSSRRSSRIGFNCSNSC